MSSCGTIEFLNGGTIQGSTIVQSDITSSTIRASTIDSSSITNLTGIDDNSAQKIVDAICQLDEAILQKLAEALGLKLDSGVAPETACSDSLTTCIRGGAGTLLGEPSEWVQIDGKNIPAY